MIAEDYVSFETAKLLKEKGFDWECFQYWHEKDNELVHSQSMHPIQNISNPCFFGPAAPTLQMAMKWLREIHNLAIELTWEHTWFASITKMTSMPESIVYEDGDRSYEVACETAIKYCLENLI